MDSIVEANPAATPRSDLNEIIDAIRHVPHQVLAAGYVSRQAPVDASDIRQEFISWVARQRKEYDSWKHAWNDWTGATQNRPGMIRMHVLCPDCRGRLISTRHGRVGPCTTCMGRRRVWSDITALWRPTDT